MTDTMIAAIMDRRGLPRDDWQAWFVAALGRAGIRVGEGGDLFDRADLLVGESRLVSVDEARRAHGSAPWYPHRTDCPWLGEVLGFFAWTLWSGEITSVLAATILFEARGVVARPDDGAFAHGVARIEYPLDHLLERFGFADGGVFLDREDPAYLASVVQEMKAVIHAAGYEASIGALATHHNPIVVGEPLVRVADGQPVDARAVLSRLRASFWGFDVAVLRNEELWRSARLP